MWLLAQRCTGHCCKAFIMKRSPERLEEDKNSDNPDFVKTANMVIYLGKDPNSFQETTKNVIPENNFKHPDLEHYYTCKHHCASSGNCLNYANRPKMCSTFPDGAEDWKGQCEFRGCTRRYALPKAVWRWIWKRYFHPYMGIRWQLNRIKWRIQDYFHPTPEVECVKESDDL